MHNTWRPFNLSTGAVDFMVSCKRGILQFVILKPFSTFLAVILQVCGVYEEGSLA